jgi:hypothetical protein
MPTSLTEFTTYDEIRAVLGVSDDELTDSTLELPLYALALSMELEDIDATLEAQYIAIKAQTDKTPLEQKLLDVVSVFSAYAISKNLLTSMPLFAPKRITDGSAETERVTDPFSGVREGVNSMYAILKNRIKRILGEMGTPITPVAFRSYVSAVGLALNPVTNL